MRFSIVVPVYNIAPYLRECLDSVLSQTFSDWECICVDDGSTDESGAILDEYVAKDARFRVVHQGNAGVSAARNAALAMMTGDWFMFVDGDDSIKPEMLKLIVRQLSEYEQDGLVLATGENRPIERLEFLTGPMAANGYPFNRVFRRTKFGPVRFRVGMRYREDLNYWSDVLCVEANWRLADIDCYNYRIRVDSATGRVNARAFRDLLSVHAHVIRNLRQAMCATDADVWNYVLHTNGSLNGAASFAFERWRALSHAERREALDLMRQTVNLVGANPYDGWNRVSLKTAGQIGVIRVVQLVRRCVRKIKRTVGIR